MDKFTIHPPSNLTDEQVRDVNDILEQCRGLIRVIDRVYGDSDISHMIKNNFIPVAQQAVVSIVTKNIF